MCYVTDLQCLHMRVFSFGSRRGLPPSAGRMRSGHDVTFRLVNRVPPIYPYAEQMATARVFPPILTRGWSASSVACLPRRMLHAVTTPDVDTRSIFIAG